ncbi:MAG: ATPase [Deltaproteobacteria bacterium]|nr:ATPase [Deltaproteobacteria bacterium]
MRIAIPVLKGRLATHFREFKQVTLLDAENKEIKERKRLTRPIIELWMLPRWLRDHDVDLIIAGNVNERATSLFQKAGIKIVTGAPPLPPEEVVQKYLTDTLVMN